MRTGITIRVKDTLVFIPYSKVSFVQELGPNDFKVRMSGGADFSFTDKEAFERIKNYVLMKHPVRDDIQAPRGV